MIGPAYHADSELAVHICDFALANKMTGASKNVIDVLEISPNQGGVFSTTMR